MPKTIFDLNFQPLFVSILDRGAKLDIQCPTNIVGTAVSAASAVEIAFVSLEYQSVMKTMNRMLYFVFGKGPSRYMNTYSRAP